MKGQWIGRYVGTNSGLAILDLDEEDTHYRGHVFAFDDREGLPTVVAEVVTPDKGPEHTITTTAIAAVRPGTTLLISREQLAQDYPDIAFPSQFTFTLLETENGLSANWTSDLGTSGTASLASSDCDKGSELTPLPEVTGWTSFKDYVLSLPHRKYIFRGQDVCKRLRTSFHRTRRKDLVRYLFTDVQEAHRALTARTRHVFDLGRSEQNAAFLNLLQHHGFPTPLLDWTHSPFVAAFFAYRHRRERPLDDDKVRIFIFNRELWMSRWSQVQSITFARPHFSILEALSIENQRAIPQQALLSATNVDDIESYVRSKEAEAGQTYLQAVDLPISERRRVMEELSGMGITAGSLLPGLDGACEELRGRFFYPLV